MLNAEIEISSLNALWTPRLHDSHFANLFCYIYTNDCKSESALIKFNQKLIASPFGISTSTESIPELGKGTRWTSSITLQIRPYLWQKDSFANLLKPTALGVHMNGWIISSSSRSMAGFGFSIALRTKYGRSWWTADARETPRISCG